MATGQDVSAKGARPQTRRADRRINYHSLSAEIVETLCDMILIGELPPGQQVGQEELANELGVSTTRPVREALIQLSHEGLIEARRCRAFLALVLDPWVG